MRYRIALCLNLSTWTSAEECVFLDKVLSRKEFATWTRARATAIFYSDDPSEFMSRLLAENFKIQSFLWINISAQ